MSQALLIAFYLLFPVFILFLTWRFKAAEKIGAVLIAYLAGLILGNTDVLPENAAQIQELMTSITIPLALPLLLFSMNIRSWVSKLGGTFLSLLLGIVSLLIPVIGGFYLFRDNIDEAWKIAGLLTGVYTGGTPNLAAIKIALDVKEETYILTHTYDMFLSAVFLLFVMSIGQRVLLRFLKPYPKTNRENPEAETESKSKSRRPFFHVFRKQTLLPLLASLGISVLILAIGGGVSMLFPESASMAVAILLITTLGIFVSLIPRVNKIQHTFDFGMYFILVFSIVVASMADFSNFGIAQAHLLLFITLCVIGSFIIHVLLSKIFRVDADNVIIVSTALACSPPFVPVVASALKNKEIILSGLAVGIIGYAIGNYLGISIAWILHAFHF
jgi:uncharacterized membrane protein